MELAHSRLTGNKPSPHYTQHLMKTVVSLNVPRLLCTSSKHQSKPISDIPVEKTGKAGDEAVKYFASDVQL